MSLIESDLKSRIEEEIREMAERRASEIIEDHLAKTAESPCAERPPVRAIAPTLMEEDIIEAVKAPTPVRSVPPVAAAPYSSPPPAYSQPPPAYSSPPTALYSSPPGAIYSQASYSSPPPPYSSPPPAYSQPPPAYSQPPPAYSQPPPPMSSHPSMPPASMHPASIFPHSTPNYIVWPEVAEPTLRGAVEAAPRRSNMLLMAVAALALALSGAAFAASTGHLGNATASAAPVTKPLTHVDTATGTAPQAEDPAFAATAPAPTLATPTAGNDAPRWSRRYKGPDAQLAPAAPAAPAKPTEKAATKDVKEVKEPAPVAQPEPAAAPPPPAAPPAPSMDQASKTAQMLREQLNSSVK
jgi:hypothetical protein